MTEEQEWYRETYLKSGHWRSRRLVAIYVKGEECESCGRGHGLDVHHLNYDNLWHEKEEDLKVLCRLCHEAEHLEGTGREDVLRLIANLAQAKSIRLKGKDGVLTVMDWESERGKM